MFTKEWWIIITVLIAIVKKKKKRGFGVEESVEIVQLGLNQNEHCKYFQQFVFNHD